MWGYADLVLIPRQRADASLRGTPRGNLSDLYPRWLGSRELLLHRRDPYAQDITREIQRGYYGRELDPSRANDPKDQQGFAYPVYVAFLLAPSVRLPFPLVQAGFRWLLILLSAASVPLWSRVLRQPSSCSSLAIWILLTLGSFPALQGIKLQQLTLLVCAILAGALALLIAGYPVLAGVLLALATIKPQLVAILAAWLLLWTLSDWYRRQRLAWSFSASLLILVLAGEALLPGWISRFRLAATQYLHYTGGGKAVLDLVLPDMLAKIAGILLIVGLTVFCWHTRRAGVDDPAFAWALALVLAVTLAVIPTYAPYNQLLLLPPLMMIASSLPQLWRKSRLTRWLILIVGLSLLWPWLTAAALCVACLFLPPAKVQNAWAMPLFASPYIPLTVLGLTTLCAVEAIKSAPASPRS